MLLFQNRVLKAMCTIGKILMLKCTWQQMASSQPVKLVFVGSQGKQTIEGCALRLASTRKLEQKSRVSIATVVFYSVHMKLQGAIVDERL